MTPYLPPSMLEKRVKWDTFLSFRGEDTRHVFTTQLRDALKLKSLTPFMDDEGMDRGDTIQPSLDEAIVDSALAVVIVSPRYADSHWCLKELCRIFECKKRVIPVFYHVDPSDVRDQSGEFGEGFQKVLDEYPKRFSEDPVKKKKSEDDIESWRKALENVANMSGCTFSCPKQSDNHNEVMNRIVQQVWSELKNKSECEVKLDVGLDHRVEKVVDMLSLDHKDVRFLNIHGTSGVGKTTLAKAVYNKVAMNFKNRCFISNVTEKLKHEGGILSVRNELFKELSLENVQSLETVVTKDRVLLVLDDVSKTEQLVDLGIVREWFGEGSRIIITSESAKITLEPERDNDVNYEAEKLNDSESLELFSICALGRLEPTSEFKEISEEIVSLMCGLPLALEVFGSSLVKKSKKEWKESLNRLKCNPRQNLEHVLKLCYEGLEKKEKTAFLDISCLLLQNDMKRDDVVHVLAGCGLSAELAIGKLVMKSLLKITEGNKLWMHDKVREMGRKIVIQENADVGSRSRLWDPTYTMSVLRQGKVTEDVRGIVLNIRKPSDVTNGMIWSKERTSRLNPINEDDDSVLHTKWFEKMQNLKLLQMDYAKLQGSLKDMPSELRWLQWKGCPLKSLPIHIPEELRVLDLSGSNIERLWSSDYSWRGYNKVAKNLVVLNLSYCPKLTTLPDMSGHKYLKKLNLEQCVGLTKIHESLGNMSSLVHLNLEGCINLAAFPRDVTGMKGLKELILSNCSKVSELPQDLRSMKSLNRLLLDGTSITELPNTVLHLTQLEVLRLNSCHDQNSRFSDFKSLTSLKELSYSGTKPKTSSGFFGWFTGN